MNEQTPSPDPHPQPGSADLPESLGPRVGALDSADLFKHGREVQIRHGSEIYRLRLTKSGKLILHK